MNVGSLFSGIGMFDLGLERAGMRVVWQCEQNEYRRKVLALRWPEVPCYDDVRALVADSECGGRDGLHERREPRHMATDARLGGEDGPYGRPAIDPSREREGRALSVPVPYVDVLCGGFPCQDLSLAGKGAGIEGSRSGLWSEFARLIGELRPRYVLVENVPALAFRGLGRVLGDLAALGYDAEWDCLPAAAFGAPHRRDRLWLVAYPNGEGEPGEPVDARPGRGVMVPSVADAEGGSRSNEPSVPDGAALLGTEPRTSGRDQHGHLAAGVRVDRRTPASLKGDVADADGAGLERAGIPGRSSERSVADPDGMGDTNSASENPHAETGGSWPPVGERGGRRAESELRGMADGCATGLDLGGVDVSQWDAEWPDVPRVAQDVSNRVDRLSALGDSLVPQIAEWIGRRIMSYENALAEAA